jgi:hypothetical protein
MMSDRDLQESSKRWITLWMKCGKPVDNPVDKLPSF